MLESACSGPAAPAPPLSASEGAPHLDVDAPGRREASERTPSRTSLLCEHCAAFPSSLPPAGRSWDELCIIRALASPRDHPCGAAESRPATSRSGPSHTSPWSHTLLLAIDIGNTSIAIGVYDGPRLASRLRMATDADRPAEEYARDLAGQLSHHGVEPQRIAGAALSSTVPALEATFEAVCRDSFGFEPLVVGAQLQAGIPIRCDDPRELGADRILHVVAALARHPPPLIVVDLGTALVLDAISAEGDYLGGTIAPGIGIASDALFERAAKLPSVSIERPRMEGVIGRNTEHSMQSGIVYGYAEMVCGMVRRLKAEIGAHATVIATGGYAHVIADVACCIDALEDDLNLEGLRLIYEANR